MRKELTESLLRAFFEEWASRGFAALSLEAVAKRAGAGKAALYRRWPSKLAMAREAMDSVAVSLTATASRDSLAADVGMLLAALRRALRHPIGRLVVPDLNAEIVRSPEFAAAMRPMQDQRRRHGEALLRRAVARGELPDGIDVEMANDLLIAPLYWRMLVVTDRTDRAYLDRLTAVTVAALVALGELAR